MFSKGINPSAQSAAGHRARDRLLRGVRTIIKDLLKQPSSRQGLRWRTRVALSLLAAAVAGLIFLRSRDG